MISTDSGFLAPHLKALVPWLFSDSNYWTVLGFVATFMFSARFFIQWLMSEKHQRIVVPASFWYLSFFGSVLQLIYVIHVDKAPLILGYILLPFMNARSLWIHIKKGDGSRGK